MYTFANDSLLQLQPIVLLTSLLNMKQHLIVSIILFLSLFPAFECNAYNVFVTETGEMIESETLPTCKQSLEKVENRYRVTYTFDTLVVVHDDIFEGKKYFALPGFGLSEDSGYAATLGGKRQFTLDDMAICEVTGISVDFADYQSWDYSPARPPLLNSSDERLTAEDITPISETDAFLPEVPVDMLDVSYYRGYPITNILISPIQYNSKTKTVRINKRISFFIDELEIDALSNDRLSGEIANDDMTLETTVWDLLMMEKDFKDTKETYPIDRHYLIVTSSTFMNQVNKFAEWKRKMGYTVEIASKDQWSSSEIKETIKACFEQRGNLYYVLLVGDVTTVPPCNSRCEHPYSRSFFLTDVPYSCLDGEDDFYPDIYLGRIPASTEAEATAAFDKIIAYEKDPSFGEKRSKAICSSYFQDKKPKDGIEDRGFVFITERIYNYLRTPYNDVERIYYASPSVSPLKWSSQYGSGAPVPDYLRRPNFNWDGDKNDIIDAINSGCNLFYHRDHGGYIGWENPGINSSDLTSLNNNRYPIVLSIDCNVGNFKSPDYFGRKLLGLKNAGAATVVAAVEVSYSGRNDAFVSGMIDAIWPSPGLSYTYGDYHYNKNEELTAQCVGEMMVQGMNRVDESYSYKKSDGKYRLYDTDKAQKDLYHCLGDPSLSLFYNPETPTSDVAYSAIHDGDRLIISGLNRRCNISFYNETTGVSRRFSGFGAEFACQNTDNVSVIISKPGYKPIIRSKFDYTNLSNNIKSVTFASGEIIIKLCDDFDFRKAANLTIIYCRTNYPLPSSQPIIEGNYVYTFKIPAGVVGSAGGEMHMVTIRDGDKILDYVKLPVK